MPGPWGTSGCGGDDPEQLLGNGGPLSNIVPTSHVDRLPYIGAQLSGRLNGRGIVTVQDLIQHFQRAPNPYSVAQLHLRMSRLLRNFRDNQCVAWGNDKQYQVSDVNQCAYNAVAKTLAHVHQNWPVAFAVPNAPALQYRNRGDTDEVRQCACARTAGECNALLQGGCRWTPRNHTHMTVGACTPNNPADTGFVGQSNNDRYDQQTQRVTNRARVHVVGHANNGPHHYVRQWRVPTPPPPPPAAAGIGARVRRRRQHRRQEARRRSRRRRNRQRGRRRTGPTRLRAGGELHACGTGGHALNPEQCVTPPDPTWDARTMRQWARAVVDRMS